LSFFFTPNPKKHLGFTKLIDMMETKGPKIFMNVKTQWISLLELLCRIFKKYKPFLAKMFKDMINNQVIKVPYYLFS
jgi:molecular chaperone DnaK (HSP70)